MYTTEIGRLAWLGLAEMRWAGLVWDGMIWAMRPRHRVVMYGLLQQALLKGGHRVGADFGVALFKFLAQLFGQVVEVDVSTAR